MSNPEDSSQVTATSDPEPSKPAPSKADRPLKKCRCGHDRTNPLVSASGEYTFGGWCLILFGISAKPTAIKYQCRRCDEVIERSTDPVVIAETRLWG